MKRFKRWAVFLATNLETLGMVPVLVPGPYSTKCYLSALYLYFSGNLKDIKDHILDYIERCKIFLQ